MVIFITSCSNLQVEKAANNPSLQKINIPKEEVINNDIVESASYIFLDSEYLIGNISRILFFENNIYIHDEMTNRIVAFSMKGKYLFHIDQKGKGPGEYLKLSDFAIDEAKRNILIFDENSHKILRYSIDGQKFIHEQKIDFYPTAFAWNSNCLFFYNPFTFNYPRNEKYHYSLIKTSDEMEKEKRYFSIDKKIGNFMSDPNPKGFFYGNNLCMLNRFDNIIYSLAKDSIYANYKILFADNDDYQNALNDAISKGTRDIDRYHNCAADIGDFCESDDFMTFSYFRNNKNYSVIFSKKKKSIILHQARFSIFSKKSLRNNIPIFINPSNVKGDLFVSIIPCNLIEQLTNHKNFQKLMMENMSDTDLVEKLKNFDLNSNPVIVFYKFKSQ
jgi:hypothetical protein